MAALSSRAPRALRLALYVLAVLALVPAAWLALLPWGVRPEDGLIALHLPLGAKDSAGVRVRFVPKWSDYHDVALAFPSDTGDPAVELALERTIAIRAGAERPPYEFEWQLLHDGTIVAQGGGRRSAAGAVLGEGSGRKLLFGEFRARAGKTYELRASFGPAMSRFLGASPALEVRMSNTPRVNRLKYFRRLDGAASLALGVIGLGFLAAGLRLEKKRAPTPPSTSADSSGPWRSASARPRGTLWPWQGSTAGRPARTTRRKRP